MKDEIIHQAEVFVKKQMSNDATGHDWFHVDRVRRNALVICKQENSGDPFIIEIAALLHDIPDDKLNESAETGREKLDTFLKTLSLPEDQTAHIKGIIETISFKGGKGSVLSSAEAEIVQDADRLDAIGAIGIARAFAYGGKKGQPIYDPEIKIREDMNIEEYRNGKSTSIHHFYEKLLNLKDRLNTPAAKELADSRHKMLELFLDEFYKEWNGQ